MTANDVTILVGGLAVMGTLAAAYIQSRGNFVNKLIDRVNEMEKSRDGHDTKMQEQLETMAQAVFGLRNELLQVKGELVSARGEITSLRTENVTLMAENAELTNHNHKLIEDNNSLRKTNEELRFNIKLMEEQNKTVLDELNFVRQKVSVFVGEVPAPDIEKN